MPRKGPRTPEQRAVEAAQARARYAANPDKYRARNAVVYAANREWTKARKAAWVAGNPGKVKTTSAAWRAENPERVKAYYAANPMGRRETRLKRVYNITLAQYRAMLLRQDRACAICGKKFIAEFHRTIHIDHDHATKRVRGVLCHLCNSILGYARDQAEVLQKAIDYLNSSTPENHVI